MWHRYNGYNELAVSMNNVFEFNLLPQIHEIWGFFSKYIIFFIVLENSQVSPTYTKYKKMIKIIAAYDISKLFECPRLLRFAFLSVY